MSSKNKKFLYNCVLCDEEFNNCKDMINHAKNKHTEDNHIWYQCNICDEEFDSCKDLLNHAKQHFNNDEYLEVNFVML